MGPSCLSDRLFGFSAMFGTCDGLAAIWIAQCDRLPRPKPILSYDMLRRRAGLVPFQSCVVPRLMSREGNAERRTLSSSCVAAQECHAEELERNSKRCRTVPVKHDLSDESLARGESPVADTSADIAACADSSTPISDAAGRSKRQLL